MTRKNYQGTNVMSADDYAYTTDLPKKRSAILAPLRKALKKLKATDKETQ